MTKTEKLARLKNYATRYEIAAKGPQGETVLVMYGNKSRRSILDGLLQNDYHRLSLLAAATHTEPESWKVNPDKSITCEGWSIGPTGRTQREAVCEGELTESIYD